MSVAISLYGMDSHSHDAVTLVDSSFTKTIHALKQLHAANISVRVAIIGMRTNEEVIDKTIHFLNTDIGITDIGIDVVRFAGRGCNSDLKPSEEFLRQFDLWSPDFSQVSRVTFNARQKGHDCFSTNICVSATGLVYPCIMARKYPIGNILELSLDQIWRSNLAMDFQRLTKDTVEICKDCEYRYACFDCRIKVSCTVKPNLWTKPSWCHYNPYLGTWSD